MLDLQNLYLTFGKGSVLEVKAIQGIACQFARGEFVTIIGSNGAGKSTLLNLIAGVFRPSVGKIVLDGQDISQWDVAKRSGQIARVFQDPLKGTCADLTLAENLALALSRGKKRGVSLAINAQLIRRLETLVEPIGLGLERRLNEKIHLLSGGQRQALSLMMTTLQPLSLLLLDEHTAALDPKTASQVMKQTQRIAEQEPPIILMVTHSMTQAIEYGNRIIMMHQGNILMDLSGDDRAKATPEYLVSQFHALDTDALSDTLLLS